MKTEKRQFGDFGERIACDFLTKKGYIVIDVNLKNTIINTILNNSEKISKNNIECMIDSENNIEKKIFLNNESNNLAMLLDDVIEHDRPASLGPSIIIIENKKEYIKKKKYCNIQKESSCIII